MIVDEEKVKEYLKKCSTDCSNINMKLRKLQAALDKFVAFDEYSGKEAESAKAFIKNVEQPMAEDISVALNELVRMQNIILEELDTEFAPSKVADIYTEKFNLIEQDYKKICDGLELCIDTCNVHLDSDEPVSSIYDALCNVYYDSDMEDSEKSDASTVKDVINWFNFLTDRKLKNVTYKICESMVNSGVIEDLKKLYHSLSEEERGDIHTIVNLIVAFYAEHEEELYHLPIWHEIIADFLGFVYDPETKCYHTKEGSLQNAMGFGVTFDKLGPLLGMDLAEVSVVFKYNNRHYLFEIWVGKYGYGSCSGGEIGIYSLSTNEYEQIKKNGESVFFQCAKEYEQFIMKFVVRNRKTGEVISSKDSSKGDGDGSDFWGLAIKTDDHTDKEDLEIAASINHDDIEYLLALQQMLQEKVKTILDKNNQKLSFTFSYYKMKHSYV
ncbi:DUF4474 domain-containing protein [Anaerosacchariphilus polymeriproducens]|uniref:DUF4474 domain-containing protein n=1 Tax=Anaerosacchariphilus polymeriproducens TaxID=1812858 RepID=A0A371AYX4_9FIRM|nr:DUF4474 domain-containing protein [Anaerosacchariphilus polymeriproducens]RDU24702.1 DUF4474 domain-containing protein [Anaerosacchariphilus polymeriproducens]